MPPDGPSDHALAVARQVAAELAEDGAGAAVLVGSHARGDGRPESDADVLVVGPLTFIFRLERRAGLLVSASPQPFEAYRREMADPGSVCTAVPGWREALVIHDPEGKAGALIEEARAWTWGPLKRRCDAWVAEEIISLAEEAHKLVAALRAGHRTMTAVQRSVLALHPAQILAVHRRILYGSENRLWDLVAETMGEEWHVAQSAALGLNEEPFEETCRAALKLYGLAVDNVCQLLGERQRGVANHARLLAATEG